MMLKVSSSCLHHGEEPIISGRTGSGTIFFSNCLLKCLYCQNYEISWGGKGEEKDIDQLVEIMLGLQEQKAHNINLVSPTHYGKPIVAALEKAKNSGLKIPVVYNTGGYDSLELLKAFEGLVDIYLPDFKYFDDAKAFKYSGAKAYVATAKAALIEMFRQVGNIQLNEAGLAQKGVLVRHLILPNNLSDGDKVLDFLATLSIDLWISLMSQYSPQYRAKEYPELNRKITSREYQEVIEYAENLGFHNLYAQEPESSELFLPDFQKADPFA